MSESPDPGQAAGTNRVVLAAAAGPHGVNGAVRLKLFCEGIDSLSRHDDLFVGERALMLTDLRPSGSQGAVARFQGVTTREEAAALSGREVWVPRDRLPPLGEGEYYHADLIGLSCADGAGNVFGKVVGVDNFGAGDLLDIEKPDGRRSLIPFRPGISEVKEGGILIDPEFLA